MWGWLFVFLTLALLFYIYFLKRALRKLNREITVISERSSYGGRLSFDFREKELMELVDELNQMIDAFEKNNRLAHQMEENVRLSIAGLSHDLRTPLTSINGYIQLLNEVTDEERRKHYLRIIGHSVKRLMEMTDHFYDLARIETNQKEITLSSISLPNLIEEVFLSYYEQFDEHDIQLQFPEQRRNYKIIADEFMLVRVIQNVIQNILRYAESRAIIRYKNVGNNVIFTIQNDIKSDSKVSAEKVFLRFYTAVTSRTNTEASGLGLYLSKKLVEKMNGEMEAELRDNWFVLNIKLPTKGNIL